MKRTIPIVIVVVMIMATVMGVACRGGIKKPADEVTVQLKWLHQAQFAGFYAADQKGYYDAEGLTVTFIKGGPTVNTCMTVLNNTAQFGIAGADELIVWRANGKPVRAIATIYRRSPLVFVAAADSGIRRPQDFVGQNILAALNAIPTLQAMMANVGIAGDQYTVVTLPFDVALFASGETTVWGVYTTGSIRILQQAGYKLNIIYPDDYGVHFYSDTIFATDDFIAANPELILRFLRATLQGWQWAVENSEAAALLTLEYDPTLDGAIQTAQMEASLPLFHTGEDYIGWMRDEVWQQMHDVLLKQGLLDKPVDMDEMYTMQFLNKIYGKAE